MEQTLAATLAEVAGRIKKHGSQSIGEQNTKQALITPVLKALGWDMEDLDEVRLEFKPKPSHNPVDYALFMVRTPKLFVEAKGLGENLTDGKWSSQIISYATVAGVLWVALTDGDEWRIYNSHAPVPVEDKLFRCVRISKDVDEAQKTLILLSKAQMTDNAIDLQWKAHFVDRQVSKALEVMLSTQDPALVKLLRKKAAALMPADIKASLQRLRVQLDFPAEVSIVGPKQLSEKVTLSLVPSTNVVGSPKVKGAKPSIQGPPPWQGISLAQVLAAGVLKPGATIETSYRGIHLAATVRANGHIEYAGASYDSPSTAALAALHGAGATDRISENGWTFWRVKQASGMVRLGDLRRLAYQKDVTASH